LRDAALRALKEHPVVRQLAGSSAGPLEGMFPAVALRPNDQRAAAAAQVRYNFVSSDYFSVLGIPIVVGRVFTADEERGHAQVAVVSQSLASAFWPGRNPVGQIVRLAVDAPAGSPLEAVRTARVVGVARNAVSGWIGTGLDRPVIYFPARLETAGMLLLARVGGSEALARARLDNDVPSALAAAPIDEIHTLNDLLAMQVYPFRAFSWVAMALGATALLLAAGAVAAIALSGGGGSGTGGGGGGSGGGGVNPGVTGGDVPGQGGSPDDNSELGIRKDQAEAGVAPDTSAATAAGADVGGDDDSGLPTAALVAIALLGLSAVAGGVYLLRDYLPSGLTSRLPGASR
jgi:hypothetical protein